MKNMKSIAYENAISRSITRCIRMCILDAIYHQSTVIHSDIIHVHLKVSV